MSPTLLSVTTRIILPSFPGLLVNSHSNNEKPGLHRLPPINLIDQFQYTPMKISELLIQIPVGNWFNQLKYSAYV